MTEEKLLARLKKRDTKALERMIGQYSAYVGAVIGAVLGPSRRTEDVEELASDVFLAVWNHAADVTPGKLRPYLGAAARNTAKSFLRKQRELPMDLDELPGLAQGDTPENRMLRQEQARLVREAVLEMEQPDREIFLRRYYYLQSSVQIGQALNMEPGTVRIRLMRGRNVLKQKLRKEDVL